MGEHNEVLGRSPIACHKPPTIERPTLNLGGRRANPQSQPTNLPRHGHTKLRQTTIEVVHLADQPNQDETEAHDRDNEQTQDRREDCPHSFPPT